MPFGQFLRDGLGPGLALDPLPLAVDDVEGRRGISEPVREVLVDEPGLGHVAVVGRPVVVVVLEVNVNCKFGYDINCEVVCEEGVINLPCPSFPTIRSNFEVSTAIEKNWILRFIDSYDVELQDWVDHVLEGTTGGSSAWDGYTAALTADALVASQKSGKVEKVVTGGTPEFYK